MELSRVKGKERYHFNVPAPNPSCRPSLPLLPPSELVFLKSILNANKVSSFSPGQVSFAHDGTVIGKRSAYLYYPPMSVLAVFLFSLLFC